MINKSNLSIQYQRLADLYKVSGDTNEEIQEKVNKIIESRHNKIFSNILLA